MMKKKNQVLVSLSIVALLGGCSEEQVQRDVYNSLEDCLADWQKIELCEADQSSENNVGTTVNAGSGSSLSGNLNTRPSNNSEWSEDNQTVKQTLNPDGATHSGNSSGSEGTSHTTAFVLVAGSASKIGRTALQAIKVLPPPVGTLKQRFGTPGITFGIALKSGLISPAKTGETPLRHSLFRSAVPDSGSGPI